MSSMFGLVCLFGRSGFASELQWGNWAAQQIQLQQDVFPRRRKNQAVFLHSSYFLQDF